MNSGFSGHCCFVTGATGFVGSHLVRALLARGMRVVAAHRVPHPDNARALPGLRVIHRTLSELRPEDFAGCDLFLHAAAQLPAPGITLAEYMHINCMQALHAFGCAAEGGVTRCLHLGSGLEFGTSGHEEERLTVRSPLRPMGGYAVSKAAASLALTEWAREAGIAFSLLRLFHLFGPDRSATRFWAALRVAAAEGRDFAMTEGRQVLDFTPVAYAVEWILCECLRADLVPGRPVARHIGTGRPQTLRRFAQYWWRHWNAPGQLLFGALPYREGEVMRCVPEVEAPAPADVCPWA